MLEATTQNTNWIECKYCMAYVAKAIFTKHGIVFEIEGIKGNKSYFDSTFLITHCPKCNRKNVVIQFDGDEKFRHFDTEYLGGPSHQIIQNPHLLKKLEANLTVVEKEVLKASKLANDKNDKSFYWIIEAANISEMPVNVFINHWSDVVDKIIALENELGIDKDY